MREITSVEVREREIQILKYVKDVCNKNNLKYYLYAGTLAGAVNYKGFLPGDDDIDVILPRKDYEKLLSLLSEDKCYELFTPYNNKNYYYPFAKLSDKETVLREKSRTVIEGLGVHIDIFPMDGLPKYFKKFYLWKMRILKNLLLTKMVDKPKVYKVRHLYYLFKYYIIIIINYLFEDKGDNYFALLIDKRAKKYSYNTSLYVSLVNYGSRNNNYIAKADFCKQANYWFNNDCYTSIEDNSLLLGRIYGKKKKKKHNISHGFIAFLK